MDRKIRALFVPCIAILLTASCVAPQVAGVDGEKQVQSLSAEENDALCDHISTKLSGYWSAESLPAGLCNYGGSLAASMSDGDHDQRVNACEEIAGECMVMMEEGDFMDLGDEDMCVSDEELAQCGVSVAELDTCIDAALAWSLAPLYELSELSCSELATDEGIEVMKEAENRLELMETKSPDVEECSAVIERCPTLL